MVHQGRTGARSAPVPRRRREGCAVTMRSPGSGTGPRRWLGWLVGAAVITAACSTNDATEAGTSRPPPEVGSDGSAVVVEVIDGDTLDVELSDGTVDRVRIIGINAPESDECFAAEATAGLSDLVAGERVELVADRTDRDRYDRLLRYVVLAGEDIGARLVSDGLGVVRVSAPDDAREDVLRELESDARDAERGLWSPTACGPSQRDAAAVAITRIRLDAEGNDAENLNDEWIEVSNTGTSAVDLTGWRVRDESSSHRFAFPGGFSLGPGATVRIHSGCGSDSDANLFWCTSGSAIWNNDGDTAFLADPSGNIVDRRAA